MGAAVGGTDSKGARCCTSSSQTVEASAIANQLQEQLAIIGERINTEKFTVPASICDLKGKVIADQGPRILVPPRGESVYTEWIMPNSGEELIVSTEEDGSVTIETEVGEQHVIPSEPSGGNTECTNGAYGTGGSKWGTRRLDWYFKSSTAPVGPPFNGVVQDLLNGYNRWQTTYNACGFSDTLNMSNAYQGNTTLSSRIDAAATCTGSDGVSVVDFGNLANGTGTVPLAVNCTYPGSSTRPATDSDIKFERERYRWFSGPIPSYCNNQLYSIENVMVHEVGHSYGLGHNSSSSNYLTMTPGIGVCARYQVSLGKGDIDGANFIGY